MNGNLSYERDCFLTDHRGLRGRFLDLLVLARVFSRQDCHIFRRLPIDRGEAILDQVIVGFGEMAAPVEAAIDRERRGV